MNKKNTIFASDASLARKLKVLGKKSRGIRREFTKEESELNPESKKFTRLIKKRKGIRRKFTKEESKLSHKSKKLAGITKGRKGIRREFTKEESEIILQDKKLAEITKEERKKKKITRGQLSMTEKRLGIKAEQLAVVAKEKESVRNKLVVTAKKLAVTAKEKESIRLKLQTTAKNLKIKAENLVVIAKEKESIRLKLQTTAKNLKIKAENLVVTAKEKESIKHKLEITAQKLAVTAKEKESVRRKLVVTAKKLAVTAKEKESARRKLVVTAKEKESVRRKLVVTANELKKSRETLEKKVLERTKDLEQARSKDETVLASIGDGLVTVDKEGKITYVNQAFEEMIGWKTQEVLGKSMVEIVPREDEKGNVIPFKEMILTRVLSGEKVVDDLTNSFYFIRKDKSRFPASIIVKSIILKGKITGAVETFRDITKEKDIDKVKTEFVSLASHQLRTPLSAINWYTEMLLAGDIGLLNEEQKKYLGEVAMGSKRMVDLVNALLNVSRLDLGTFIVEPEPTNVVEIAKSVVDELRSQIIEKKLKVEELYGDNIPEFQADKKLLRMVFQNLLSNAVKYTQNGGIIKMELVVILKGQNFGGKDIKEDSITIKISDTGMGIPINQKDKIFSKLFRADNARETEIEGNGLGLYIIKSIIDHSEGLIWFESEENKGTTFYVVFPLSGMKKKEGTKKLD